MKVVIEKHYSDAYTAVDDNTYAGPGSPIGFWVDPAGRRAGSARKTGGGKWLVIMTRISGTTKSRTRTT